MPRLEGQEMQTKNPITKILYYKSELKKFEYWNKEKQEKEYLEPPFKFIFLGHFNCIGGWHTTSKCAIYSNQIFDTLKEKIIVKTKINGTIFEGIYKEIKDKIKLVGGVFYKSIYVMLEDGSLANIKLKGTVLSGLSKEVSISKEDVLGYSDFFNKNNHLLDNQWIEVKSFAEAKKGATKFSIPIFEVGTHLTNEQNEKAEHCLLLLKNYIKSKNNNNLIIEEQQPKGIVNLDDIDLDDIDIENNDLPF